jgi:2-polyprenyl-3-methyl-5-hydroxy-6-metoxy-1,4-benzoquinol methylase
MRYQAQTDSRRACVIYDIGCAQGFLGQLLPPADFRLFGVDAVPAAVEAARPFYRVVQQADIESPLRFAFPEPPDVLVLADVLEHTRQPADCLTHLCQQYLPVGARVIISVPNVAHFYVRFSLLLGRFEYTERGLLDKTHLQFFTRASALRLARACGIAVETVRVTPTPLPLVNPLFGEGRLLWPVHQLNAACSRWFPTLLGYQTILYGIYQP